MKSSTKSSPSLSSANSLSSGSSSIVVRTSIKNLLAAMHTIINFPCMDNDENNKFASSSSTESIKEAIIAVKRSGKTDAEVFDKILPTGYRFDPTDVELIDYLNMKCCGERLPTDQIIETKLYACDPEVLTGAHKLCREKEWYFLIPREKNSTYAVRASRSITGTTDAFWKATGSETPIKRDGLKIGARTVLDFYRGKRPHAKKTEWKMYEYTLAAPRPADSSNQVFAAASTSSKQLDEWAVCRIYKNTRSVKKKDSDNDDGDDQQELGGGGVVIPGDHQDDNALKAMKQYLITMVVPKDQEPDKHHQYCSLLSMILI